MVNALKAVCRCSCREREGEDVEDCGGGEGGKGWDAVAGQTDLP